MTTDRMDCYMLMESIYTIHTLQQSRMTMFIAAVASSGAMLSL
jgi:hypothetical protein